RVFFFQAEDGIRDRNVTGVQTCALPIFTVDVRGEILQIKDVINRMVDQLNAFAAEVTRVAKEVGTDGKLGSQAEVKGVAGTWKRSEERRVGKEWRERWAPRE